MSDESKRLTPNDPVPMDTLQAFGHIEDARVRIALEILGVEQRKVQLLAAAKKVDEQHTRLFETILVERGLSPKTRVDIDSRTGALKVLDSEPPTPPPVAEPETTP
jgi:hypothetical protein